MGKTIAFMLISCLSFLYAETVEVVTFEYPPLHGKNNISDLGVIPEIMTAAFSARGIDVLTTLLPTKRAITQVDTGESLVMIGLMEYFSEESKTHLTAFPLLVVDFDLFYLKSKFPDGFSYSTIDDLRPYSIGVLLNGSTDLYGRKMKLNVDGAVTLDLVFKKLKSGRTDLCVSGDLSGFYEISRLFPDEENLFDCYGERPFLSLISSAIFNTHHPDYERLMPEFREGLKTIIRNGIWKAIVARYYGQRGIPASSLELVRNFANAK